MRKFVFVASSVCSLLAFTGGGAPAMAADLDWRSDRSMKDEPVFVPRYRFSWTGFYLGGNLGYSWGTTSSSDASGAAFDGAGGLTTHPSGWTGGLQGGYNWQFDNIVVGVEADLGLLDASERERTGTAFIDVEYGAYGTLTGRLGLTDDRWLYYLKGGFAFANIENQAGAIAGGGIDLTDLTDTEETRAGWALGLGAEYAFHPNWSMKIEYLYMDFGQDSSTNIDGDTFHHDNDLHSIKVGVNYRFGPDFTPLR
jgi:outer membrane immunogenic protein